MWPTSYFQWLKGLTPEGQVEQFPELDIKGESNLPGVFVIGDLTGVPLLKLAVESGVSVWNHLTPRSKAPWDAIIVGAGPAGLSCFRRGEELGKKVLLLESNKPFQTIQSYPKGKPIFAEPNHLPVNPILPITNGSKETLLTGLKKYLPKNKKNFRTGMRVVGISKHAQEGYLVHTERGESFHTKSVVIAIGKSGDPKTIGVPGESLPHVFYRLLDPYESKGKNLVIVGGGDSALEAAVSCANYAESITLVHRGDSFPRAKTETIQTLETLTKNKNIQIYFNSFVSEIHEKYTFIKTKNGSKKIPSDSVYVLVGSKPPVGFLSSLGIKIQNQITKLHWLGLIAMVSFALLAYFGKASFYGLNYYTYTANLGFVLAFISGCALLVSSFRMTKLWTWNHFKIAYYIVAFLYFSAVYFLAKYADVLLFGKYPSFHYTFLYSLTILLFGLRRMMVRKTQYIFWQTSTLIFIQSFFLFLLPEVLLPYLGNLGVLGSADSFWHTQVFPNQSYWKAYGFILAWPLNMGVLYDSGLTNFWFWYGMFFTFGFIPYLVYKYGKGAYCGWICSCGGLAETLGDEHRHKMPHTPFAYKIEHSGQYILFLAFLLTFLKLLSLVDLPLLQNLDYLADSMKWMYDLIVDIGLAGVVGVGLYFLFSGRIWCRMFCPLAALMHIYAKFSQFRIFSEKKKCISCNICTQNCHQGIDVMGYANRGLPMDSVQCVRCSACVSLCPTDVLQFGRISSGSIHYDSISARS